MDRNDAMVLVTSVLMLVWFCAAAARVPSGVVAEWPGMGGRKKRIKTEGYACVNEACAYYGITDEAVHAMIGYGRRGKCEAIQYFQCQACQSKVTERWGTPMYRLKTGRGRVSEVLTVLGEGFARIGGGAGVWACGSDGAALDGTSGRAQPATTRPAPAES